MDDYIVTSDNRVMVPVSQYNEEKIRRYNAGHLVYVDRTTAEDEYSINFSKKGSKYIGPKEEPSHKAGKVSSRVIQPDCLEADIHRAVVLYIKKEHPYVANFLIPGMGEYRGGKVPISIAGSGYVKGQPDITIPIGNGKYTGLCIELKRSANKPSKRGKLSEDQANVLNQYSAVGYKTVVSCDFSEIVATLDDYLGKLDIISCPICHYYTKKVKFLNHALLEIHVATNHYPDE